MLMWMRYCASFNNMDNRLVLQLIQVEALVFLGKFYRGKTLKYTMYIKSLANIQDNYHDIVDFVSASGTSFNDETLLSHSLTGQLIF